MAQRGWGDALVRMGGLMASGTTNGLTDGQLIARLADRRLAESAFEALVARHGPMVRHVCLQVLRHEHDADDAFQAVFLVLARRASSIRDPNLLAPWLYGVALRTARLDRNRRPRNVAPPASAHVEPPEGHAIRREEADILHDEIGRLPARQRRAVVLCYLQGMTHQEAAERLGIPSGTVGVHLMRARERLQSRLARRGITSSMALLGPGTLTASLRAPVALSYLRGAAAGTLPAGVTSLAKGALRPMAPLKLVFLTLALGLAFAGSRPLAKAPLAFPGPAVASPAPRAAQRPAAGRPEVFFVDDRGTASLDANGSEITRFDSISDATGVISPDGDRVAFGKVRHEGGPIDLVIQSLSRPEERFTIPDVGGAFPPLWSSDGKRILSGERGRNPGGVEGSTYRVYDLGTKGLTTLKLTASYRASDWPADGKRILATPSDRLRVAWVALDGGEPEFITAEQEVAYGAKLSPDGRRILCWLGSKADPGLRQEIRLCVIDLITKGRTIVDEPGETNGFCWSADGSRIAYTWQRPLKSPADAARRETFLITCNSDGSGRKTVTSRKFEGPPDKWWWRLGPIIFFRVHHWK